MLKADRDAVIDACIQRVLSLRDPLGGESEEEVEAIFNVTGAACFRLLQYRSEPVAVSGWQSDPVLAPMDAES